jgi:hypothetical protein
MTTRFFFRRTIGAIAGAAGIALATAAFAQEIPKQPPQPPVGGYFTVSGGALRPDSPTMIMDTTMTEGNWTSSFTSTYKRPIKAQLDLSGGVIVARHFAFGMAFSHYSASAPSTNALFLDHPPYHPPLFATYDSAPLGRSETAFHIQLGYALQRGKFQLLGFGGPSHASVTQELVVDFQGGESYNYTNSSYTASINRVTTEKTLTGGWGFHVGVDVSYFATRYIGFGGLVRYSQATVTLPNPIKQQALDRTGNELSNAGGLYMALGLRVRF